MTAIKESHHFYPVLFYFAFRDTYYSMSQLSLVCLDVVTLLKSALHDEEHAWLKESVTATQLWSSALMLVQLLEDAFLSDHHPDGDETVGADTYVALRRKWEPHIARLVRSAAFDMEQIDPVGCDPVRGETHRPFRRRLHSVP